MVVEEDLHLVNAIMEEWPADVLDPHTLLSKISPEAKVYSVIDLCQAFFLLPLAEASKELFAFQYQGKTLRYTHVPQKFKHSPYMFNQLKRGSQTPEIR